MKIKASVIAEIYAHAKAESPKESCGTIIKVGRKLSYLPASNSATKPEDDFRISGEDWAVAEDQGEIVVIVHSHPGQSAKLSGADRVSMENTELPWLIVEVREGEPVSHLIHMPTGYQAPLVGRPFHHGILDCYTLVQDFYARELGIKLLDYDRPDNWWNEAEHDFYVEKYAENGFYEIDAGDLQHGDLVIMQVRAKKLNHAGIYLVEPLKTEPDLHPLKHGILHHLYGKDSSRTPFGGFWREAAQLYLRHKDAKQPT